MNTSVKVSQHQVSWYKMLLSKLIPQTPTALQQERKLMEEELRGLVEDIRQKEHNFKNASGDFVDVAVHELNLSKSKYSTVLAEYKKLFFTREVRDKDER